MHVVKNIFKEAHKFDINRQLDFIFIHQFNPG